MVTHRAWRKRCSSARRARIGADQERTGETVLRWLSPGDLVCDVVGLPEAGENRTVLRMFVNILVWGAIGVGATVWWNS